MSVWGFAHRQQHLQLLTACFIQNGRRGLEKIQTLGFFIKISEVSGQLSQDNQNLKNQNDR